MARDDVDMKLRHRVAERCDIQLVALCYVFKRPRDARDLAHQLRLFGFVDIGNVYGENEPVQMADLRASAGIGVSWLSPLGPLRIAVAQPVRKKPGDKIQRLQFQIGTSF